MENAGVQKEQTAEASSIAGPMWDPFWFMRAMLGWGRPADAASVDVKETDDTYVCTVNVKLTLPDEADAAHVKAELKDGELRLLVPKATKTRRTTEAAGRGSARREPRRGERKRARRG